MERAARTSPALSLPAVERPPSDLNLFVSCIFFTPSAGTADAVTLGEAVEPRKELGACLEASGAQPGDPTSRRQTAGRGQWNRALRERPRLAAATTRSPRWASLPLDMFQCVPSTVQVDEWTPPGVTDPRLTDKPEDFSFCGIFPRKRHNSAGQSLLPFSSLRPRPPSRRKLRSRQLPSARRPPCSPDSRHSLRWLRRLQPPRRPFEEAARFSPTAGSHPKAACGIRSSPSAWPPPRRW